DVSPTLVTAAVTTCTAATVDVEPLKLLSPRYCAWMLWVPTDSELVANTAVPPLTATAGPSTALPLEVSMNCTKPPICDADAVLGGFTGATLAMNVTV